MFPVKIKRGQCVRLIAVSLATCLLMTLLQSLSDTSEVGQAEHLEYRERTGPLTEVNYVERHENLNLARKRAALEEKRLPRHVRSHLRDHQDQLVKVTFSASKGAKTRGSRPSEAVFYEARSGKPRETLITERNDTANKWIWGQDISEECRAKEYDLDTLPKASVVISFHENENLSHLLRTLHSIIRRTPEKLLEEIILINDNSHKEDHEMILQNYITAVFTNKTNIRLMFTHDSLGLIRARLSGVRLAKGEVIVSMDSHMEVQEGWLEPLLDAIRENPRTLATSYLDWMEKDKDDTWVYKHGPSTWKTYFDWSLVFGFQDSTKVEIEARKADVTAPVVSPVSIGTIWAMKKDVFEEIGAFDEQMEGWGGENLDLPIRLWLCGGRVLNIPCSHAGHLEQAGHRDYRKNWVSMTHYNYKRVAEVWLDEYKKYFYYYHPQVSAVNAGDLSSRRAIKEKCFQEYGRDFSWFLKEVYPEIGIPGGEDNLAWDGLQNLAFNACLSVVPPNKPTLEKCTPQPYTQGFYWNTLGHLRFPVHIFNAKQRGNLYYLETGEYISLFGSQDLTKWIHWPNGWLMWHPMNLCLHATSLKTIFLSPCDRSDPRQRWSFRRYTKKFKIFQKSIVKSSKVPQKGSIELNETIVTEVFGHEASRHQKDAFLQALAENIHKEYV
ncbi:hypothetical protein CAPTEDRAFT_164644 [Capitella teleta]|uniref:Polypeptide N-acetylgalactosaminyltransferase n=1 Tax=Capitella teleta TaxID=283909 RepID=R7T684_CAPTE|nr:hypothetical protein CAPTEDRAFT_164644 [Capitella teleta]|eukprot:ELT88930.1 hypothetical protein CAPTEDRAFT_164644 [Capitella teleta]